MSTTPAGWFPDVNGPGRLRYWDGNQWTEHVAPAAPAVEGVPEPAPITRPVPTVPAGWFPDPEGAAGQRYWDGWHWTDHFARKPILDVELRRPMRKKSDRVVLTEERLTKGDDQSIAFDQVEHVAYWVMVQQDGPFQGTKSYHFRLWGAAGDVTLAFGVPLTNTAQAPLHDHAFETLVATSARYVEPRLVDVALGRIEAGETLAIGGIDASRGGLVRGRARLAWPDYGGAVVARDHLRVHDRSGQEVLKGNDGPDGPLARPLFAALVERYG